MGRRISEEGRRDIEHTLATLRALLDAMKAHEPGVRSGADPEELHQMRTATRRLRAVLRTVRETFDPDEVTRLRSELRWLGATLGAERDADVQRDYLRALRGLTRGERTAVQGLLRGLERERARARTGTLAALEAPRYQSLLRDLDQLIEHPPLVSEDLSLRDIAGRAFRKLCDAVEDLPRAPSDHALHAVRLAVKRTRYAGELARATAGRRAERFVIRAGRVQDILGEHQDAAVTERRLRAALGEARGAPARAALRRLLRRQRLRRLAARAAFQAQWPRLERRGDRAWG
ncbi:MAG TPA: CHAD domain-containing protein [Candidatus Binatia bacterium]|nr:CHAD domain-containing protein [Candidatus Binatia bacterium]